MLLVAPGLDTRNKRPLDAKASLLIENEEAGKRKKTKQKKQGVAANHVGPLPTKIW